MTRTAMSETLFLMGRGEGREAVQAISRHWPEYLMEAAGLGLFMVSAAVFGTLLEYPRSPVRAAVPDPTVRRGIMAVLMGLTAVGIIYSPWGKRSGAHLNPAVTLSFYRLGKIQPWDAAFYVLAQFAGGTLGVLLVWVAVGAPLADPAVRYVVTVPGEPGVAAAFLAEFLISSVLMGVVLVSTNRPVIARFTGLFAGILIAAYILIEAPISGMSINPARTLGSALPARLWTGMWIYFTAPPLGMLLAAEVYSRLHPAGPVCAKLHHQNRYRCIFRCGYRSASTAATEKEG